MDAVSARRQAFAGMLAGVIYNRKPARKKVLAWFNNIGLIFYLARRGRGVQHTVRKGKLK